MHKNAQKKITRMRDVGGLDRNYHLNRIMMAAAMADGKSTKAVDSPADTWAEKYNTAHPYTEQEHKMLHHAYDAIGIDIDDAVNSHGSEPDGTHKVSPVKGFKGYKRR
jgi:hypothetical protein